VSRHSPDHEADDGNAAAPERPAPSQDAVTGAAPPHPICRPTLQGHVARRHLWLAAIAASTHVTR
jgi:hypothetical protein